MKNINKYLKSGIVLGALVYSVGTSIPTQSTYADEINTETVVKEWKPEGKVVKTGEDGVPWELYENGYLLFKPEPGKDTLSNKPGLSWKKLGFENGVKAIGFTDKVYLPEDSSDLFANTHISGGTLAEYLDASKIDTSKVKNMYNLFNGSQFTKLDLNTWDTSNVENMKFLFGHTNLTGLKIDKWNTSKVKDMSYMFYQAKELKELNIQDWNTSNVEDMSSMFDYTDLIKLDLNKWNVSKVKSMTTMFYNNVVLEELKISNWDTSNVEDMSGMFHETIKLKELDISNWNTSKVTNMTYMFAVSDLEKLDLSKWDTSKVEDMKNMFSDTPKLTYLDISNFDTSKVKDLEHIFSNSGLTRIKIGDKFAKTQLKDGLFETLDFEYIGESLTQGQKYGNKWTRLDKNTQFYTVEEWNKVFRENPEKLAGMWVREKNYNGYEIAFETGTDESIEPLEVEIGKDFDLPVPTKVKEGYHFVGWSKTQDGEIIKDKTNLGKKNETITLYAKWEKNPPVSTNTPIDENNNPILPPTVNELPEYNGGANPTDSLVNEKPEYKGSLSTNTPVDDKGELILPPTVNELPEYNGGANPIEAPVNEKPEYTGPLSTNTPVDDKGELVLPPTVNELPEYKGGVNPADAPINEKPEYKGTLSTNTPVDDKGELVLPPTVNELPEYKGGANPANSPIHEIPEYKGTLSTNTPVDENENPILPPVVEELPEYNTPVNNSTVNNEKIETTKEETKKEKELPNTNSTSILTTLVSSVIGTLGLGYKSKRRK